MTDTVPTPSPASPSTPSGAAALLEVTDLVKHFPIRGGGLVRRTVAEVQAVSGVSLSLAPGETLGLVGESGCGKSTTGRAILQLQRAHVGLGALRGRRADGARRNRQMRPVRRNLQIVFQDPYASLNPRLPVNDIIAEPLKVHHM